MTVPAIALGNKYSNKKRDNTNKSIENVSEFIV